MPLPSKQIEVFDEIATDYRKIHNDTIGLCGADSDHFSEQKVEIVRKLESASPAILDFGCGDGNSAVFFRKHFPDSHYVGIDSSEKSIDVAESRAPEGAHFAHYDGTSIPFGDETFDIVFTACVLHHVQRERHAAVLSEVRRVLRPNGRLYVFEHNPLNPVTRRIVKQCPFDAGVILLGAGYTKQLLRQVGFRELDVTYTLFFPRHALFRPFHAVESFLGRLPIGGQYFVRAEK